MDPYDGIEGLKLRSAEDLRVAEILVEADDELLAQIGFNLHHFLETKMKADLQSHKVRHPWTHDLVALLKLYPQKRVSEEDKVFAYVISCFAAESRYSDHFTLPWDGRQMLVRTRKFADMIETLWEDPQN